MWLYWIISFSQNTTSVDMSGSVLQSYLFSNNSDITKQRRKQFSNYYQGPHVVYTRVWHSPTHVITLNYVIFTNYYQGRRVSVHFNAWHMWSHWITWLAQIIIIVDMSMPHNYQTIQILLQNKERNNYQKDFKTLRTNRTHFRNSTSSIMS